MSFPGQFEEFRLWEMWIFDVKFYSEAEAAAFARPDAHGARDSRAGGILLALFGDKIEGASKTGCIAGGEEVFRSGGVRLSRTAHFFWHGEIGAYDSIARCRMSITAARGGRGCSKQRRDFVHLLSVLRVGRLQYRYSQRAFSITFCAFGRKASSSGGLKGTSGPSRVLRYDDFRAAMMPFPRITVNPGVATGKPCIRDLRFPVSRLLGLLAAGETRDSILKSYPYLEAADIEEALRYAAFLAEGETVESTW